MSRKSLAVCGVGAASAVMAAGLVFAPAAAAQEEPTNSAYAIAATGLLTIDPTPYVDDSNGAAEQSLASLNLPGNLVGLDLLNARAGEGYAKASVADLRVDVSSLGQLGLTEPLVSAQAIEASCEDGVATSSLARVAVAGVTVDVTAPPNTGIDIPGLASVLLNKQVTNPDGSVTVTALSVKVSELQTLDIASATCAPAEDDDDDNGGGTPTTTAPPTTTPGNGGDDDGDNGGDNGGDDNGSGTDNGSGGNNNGGSGTQADANGKAPVPTPVAAHLDVTG
ncbi:choice-of-anchor P family protein [Saccharomonospora sp. NPDC046836]|uniref:choice-of-anchor P family protein n=1 Tax=Saccharomonospora sp. NPDC046836 TaxID=3156921 RepID=UPI0033C18E26